MAEPWNLPQGRTEFLPVGWQSESLDGGGRESPCYGCGKVIPPQSPGIWVCMHCGRPLCYGCWRDGRHVEGYCRIPAATAEAQAAEWAKAIEEGKA